MVSRMVVKIGSHSVTDEKGALSEGKMEELVKQITALRDKGIQVILVSSGAVAAGLGELGWRRSNITIPEKQAAAAVGQGLLIEKYRSLFAARGIRIAQLLLTRSDTEDRKRFIHIRNTLETLLRHGVLPIVNENDTVTVEEIRFGDNDTLAGLVTLVTEADLLVLMTDIDALYTANPRIHKEAKPIPEVWEITPELVKMAGGEGSSVGTGGMRTKLNAARIVTESGVEMVIISSSIPDGLIRIVEGEPLGTRFHPHPRFTGKKSWIAYGTRVQGSLTLDDGAVAALQKRGRSLLFPGILSVEGDFHEGAVVSMKNREGEAIGKGMVSFSSYDLKILLERERSGEKIQSLHEVIHRDAMVIYESIEGSSS
ncbi:glutamate 5-kinase [Thermicanus aegyptius]|uniref:glutamate 5-kinase n=1 Tax=Thermicanus aegyptius TaxID=94009 RepID=UPI000402AA5A|nr:glutamate 5-kinase [Thermicanus aegyptius]